MQADALADQLGRQEVAFDELAEREDACDGQHGDVVRPELHQTHADGEHPADQSARIGNEGQEPSQQAIASPNFRPARDRATA